MQLAPEHIKIFSDCDAPIKYWMEGASIPLKVVRAGYYEDNFDKLFDKIEVNKGLDTPEINEFKIG